MSDGGIDHLNEGQIIFLLILLTFGILSCLCCCLVIRIRDFKCCFSCPPRRRRTEEPEIQIQPPITSRDFNAVSGLDKEAPPPSFQEAIALEEIQYTNTVHFTNTVTM